MTCIKQTCWRTFLSSFNCAEDTSGKWRSQSKEPTYPPALEAEEPKVSEHLATRPCHGSGWYVTKIHKWTGSADASPQKDWSRRLRTSPCTVLAWWADSHTVGLWDDSVTRGSSAVRQVKGIPELRSLHFIFCLTPRHSTSSGSEEGVQLLSGCTNSRYWPLLRVSFIKCKVRITVSPSKTCWGLPRPCLAQNRQNEKKYSTQKHEYILLTTKIQ